MVTDKLIDALASSLHQYKEVLGPRWPRFQDRLTEVLQGATRRADDRTPAEALAAASEALDRLLGEYPEFTGLRERHPPPDAPVEMRLIKSNHAAGDRVTLLKGVQNAIVPFQNLAHRLRRLSAPGGESEVAPPPPPGARARDASGKGESAARKEINGPRPDPPRQERRA